MMLFRLIRQFWQPRYWGLWLGFLAMRIQVMFPYRWQLAFGRFLGRLALKLAPYRRHITEVNLKLCFPDITGKDFDKLLKSTFESVGMGIMETAIGWWMSPRRLAKIHFDIKGQEHWNEALTNGKGVVVLSGHFAALEVCGVLFSSRFPIRALYRQHKNPLFNAVMKWRRERHGKIYDRRDFRKVIACLRDNIPLWYAGDQDYGRHHSVFTTFFGQQAATITALTKLKRLHKSMQVLPIAYYRKPDYRGYDVVIEPIMQDFPSRDELQDARRMNEVLETAILRAPSQYLWQHRRFKTRPEGQQRPYKKKREF